MPSDRAKSNLIVFKDSKLNNHPYSEQMNRLAILLALAGFQQFQSGVSEEEKREAKNCLADAIEHIQKAEEALENIWAPSLRHECKRDFTQLFDQVKRLTTKYKRPTT